MSTVQKYSHDNLDITYVDVPGDVPRVKLVCLQSQSLDELLRTLVFSTLVGTKKTLPFEELVYVDPAFSQLATDYFNELSSLDATRPELAISCADFFFEHVCRFYWHLVLNVGSKNLAIAFLKTICNIVDKWESKPKEPKKRIHKGTPYYFLTFGFLQTGNIDSAFASMFKAIDEDKKSEDSVLGTGAFKSSPAYKYASLIDDQNNYLIESIRELRKIIRRYITGFNKKTSITPKFTIRKLDARLLQNDDEDIQQIKYLFTYCLEKIRAYLAQMQSLPENDFYKIRNADLFFDLGLITDKILEKAFLSTFKIYKPKARRAMTMGDGVVLLFEKRGWIGRLTPAQRDDPRGSLNFTPNLPKRARKDMKTLIDTLFTNPITYSCNGQPVNFEMRVLLLAQKLRNFGGHNIRKQDVFVNKFKDIVKWLISAVFIATSSLPQPPLVQRPQRTPTQQQRTLAQTGIVTYSSSSPTPPTDVPPIGTLDTHGIRTGSSG